MKLLRNYGYDTRAKDMSWLLVGENHLSTFPNYPQGMFTIRTHSNTKEPTIWQSLEAGKTHGVYLWSYKKRESESMELILDAWLVDLRLLVMMLHCADGEFTNRSDGNKFLIFDPGTAITQMFCHRMILPSRVNRSRYGT